MTAGTLSLGDVAAVYPILTGLMGLEFDYDLAYEIDTFLEVAKGRYEFYHRNRDELLKKYGSERKDAKGYFEVSPVNIDAFEAALAKLDQTATKLVGPKIPDTVLKGQRVKPVTINALKRAGMLIVTPKENSQEPGQE